MRFEQQQRASGFTTYKGLTSYSAVAAEYYERHRHPTCWNFRQASVLFVRSFLERANLSGASVLELGAGRSVFCDFESSDFLRLNRVAITDYSENMLQYSSSLRPLGASLFTLDAEALGQDEFTYDLVICSLGDPYNTPQFWATTASRLTEKGKVIYTTPSKKWAARFRKLEGGINLETANFLLKDGQLVSVQSLILTRPAQIKLAKRASLELLNYETVPLLAIKEGPISRKVTAVLAPTDEILEAYIFQKASRR